MKNAALAAEIAQKHQESTGATLMSSAFCIPIAGNNPDFTVTWNNTVPQTVMLYVYGGKCEFSYGPNTGTNNPTIFLDSQDGSNGLITKTIQLPTGQGMCVDLLQYISNPTPSGITMVGVSW